MLSRKSKYGLKALLVLAQEAGERPVLIARVWRGSEALPEEVPGSHPARAQAPRLCAQPEREGRRLLSAAEPADITFGEVIRVLEGPLAMCPVSARRRIRNAWSAWMNETCGVRLAMKEVRDATAQILDHDHPRRDERARRAQRRRPASSAQCLVMPPIPTPHHRSHPASCHRPVVVDAHVRRRRCPGRTHRIASKAPSLPLRGRPALAISPSIPFRRDRARLAAAHVR